MPTEKAADKAKRMLGEGRLTIIRLDKSKLLAKCKGDSGEEYTLGWDPQLGEGGSWRCSCEAWTKFNRRCSHLRALQLVTVRPSGDQQTIEE